MGQEFVCTKDVSATDVNDAMLSCGIWVDGFRSNCIAVVKSWWWLVGDEKEVSNAGEIVGFSMLICTFLQFLQDADHTLWIEKFKIKNKNKK